MQEITFPTEKNYEIANGIDRGKAFRFKTPSSILTAGPSLWLRKDLFYRIVTLGSFGRIVCEPFAHDSLGSLRNHDGDAEDNVD